jgi:hypothetical protein
MRCAQLSHGTRLWGSLWLAAALVGVALTWLALFGTGAGDGAWTNGPRLTGHQTPALVQPFSPQRLVAGLAPDRRDHAVRP